MRKLALLFLMLLGLGATCAHAQTAPEAARAVEAFNRQDFDEAERLWKAWSERDPSAFVPLYNLACARSMRGDTKGAGEHILAAIQRGFADINQLKTDPNLRAFRKTETYTQILEGWNKFLDRRLEADMAAARKQYGSRYNYTKDEKYRLAFASAYDTVTSRQAREEVRRTADWAIKNVFTDLARGDDNEFDAWVMVVLPTSSDFQRWAIETYGDIPGTATSMLGGAYAHDQKKLVTQDLGSTLRHEFFHVLHWRSVDRLGQRHPVWIQEGLASLVEDMDQTRRGRWEPAISWRTNSIRSLAQHNKLLPIEHLATMDRSRYATNRPLANYAMSRGVFMYLHDRGKLATFYETYTDDYAEDPSGLTALLTVLGMTSGEFDESFRQWCRSLDEVYEQNSPPNLGIGVSLDLSVGDGPVIRQLTHDSAKRAGLRPGDVLTGMNGRSVRDLNEFYRVLTGLNEGQSVEVTYHRRGQHKSTKLPITGRR
jgi:hypothetical protein